MEPEICMKMLKNLSEKVRAKFPATTRGYSMVKIGRLDDAFLKVFERKASPVKGYSLQQKDNKRRKKKGKKINNKKNKSLKTKVSYLVQDFDFCACPTKNVVKRLVKRGRQQSCSQSLVPLEQRSENGPWKERHAAMLQMVFRVVWSSFGAYPA